MPGRQDVRDGSRRPDGRRGCVSITASVLRSKGGRTFVREYPTGYEPYESVPYLDSAGGDVGQLGKGLTVLEMQYLADKHPEVVAFNSNGWFKSSLQPRDRWSRWTEDPTLGTFIKNH